MRMYIGPKCYDLSLQHLFFRLEHALGNRVLHTGRSFNSSMWCDTPEGSLLSEPILRVISCSYGGGGSPPAAPNISSSTASASCSTGILHSTNSFYRVVNKRNIACSFYSLSRTRMHKCVLSCKLLCIRYWTQIVRTPYSRLAHVLVVFP